MTANRLFRASSALVIAPHPDDEVLGCGGLLTRLAHQGCEVKVVLVTQGGWITPRHQARREYEKTRYLESVAAAKIMGISTPESLGLPDNQVREDTLYDALKGCNLRDYDIVLSTSETDRHRDHKITGRVARMLRNDTVMYSIERNPLANFAVDTTEVQEVKESAIKQFHTQLKIKDWRTQVIKRDRENALFWKLGYYAETFSA